MLNAVALVTWSGLRDLAADDRLLRDALLRRDLHVDAVAWDDDVAWDRYASIVVRSTWDYHKRVDEFRRWIDAMEGLPLWNPPSLLRRNIHKGYLLELEALGVEIVPTILVPRGEDVPEVPWRDVIVKPAVSATAHRTSRGTAELASLVRESDVLVQPFVPEILTGGELSFVFLGRAFSHVVRKRPKSGDFRVQNDFGGSAERIDVPAGLVSQAEHIAATLGEDWLYARVDCVERDGRLVLMELEATEPSLFLDETAAERFADAIAVLT